MPLQQRRNAPAFRYELCPSGVGRPLVEDRELCQRAAERKTNFFGSLASELPTLTVKRV